MEPLTSNPYLTISLLSATAVWLLLGLRRDGDTLALKITRSPQAVAHSIRLAIPAGLAVYALFENGVRSELFVVFCALFLLEAGLQWRAEKELFKLHSIRELTELITRHKIALLAPAIGAATGLCVAYSFWRDSVGFLADRPTHREEIIWLITFIVMLAASEYLISQTYRSKMRMLPTSRRLRRSYRFALTLPAALGLLALLLQSQYSVILTPGRIAELTLTSVSIGLLIMYYNRLYKTAPLVLAEEREHFASKTRRGGKKRKKRKKNR